MLLATGRANSEGAVHVAAMRGNLAIISLLDYGTGEERDVTVHTITSRCRGNPVIVFVSLYCVCLCVCDYVRICVCLCVCV